VVNAEFARKIFGSVQNAIGGYYRLPDGTRIRSGDFGKRKVWETHRRTKTRDVSPDPAMASKFRMDGGALKPRSAATRRGHTEHAATNSNAGLSL